MTMTENLTKQLKKVEDLEFDAKAARLDFQRSLEVKVLRLWSVGRSVTRKQLGDERFRALNHRHFYSEVNHFAAWLLLEDPKVSFALPKSSLGKPVVYIEGTTRWVEFIRFEVSASILSKSDRDFAKDVRKRQSEATERYNKHELEMAMEVVDRATKRKSREDRKQYFANLSKVK